jgi:glycosyltransferase involved in cell wall biosynthesis
MDQHGVTGVVVLDDFFPNLSTGFRIAEFNWMLRNRVIDAVYTTQPLESALPAFRERYPELAARVLAYDPDALTDVRLASLVFLNNAAYFFPDLERASVPFVVTLYPGGGLNLGEAEAEEKLERVLGSPLLKAVITTQPLVTDYVRARAPHLNVTEIIGAAINPTYFGPGPGFRTDYFGRGSDRLRLCFVAHRYSPRGEDKGYDLFLAVVRELASRGTPVSAHVVGGFDAQVLDVSDLADMIAFHSAMPTDHLKAFFADMDLVIAPNRAGVLAPGAFDGFPTASAVEAALAGVGIVATDALRQNRLFHDGRDILVVEPDPCQIADRIDRLVASPGGIQRLAQAGLATARRHYGVDAQLWRRKSVLEAAASSVFVSSDP